MRAPVQEVPTVQPIGAVPARFTQQATPQDFGAGIGQAEERAAADIGQGGNELYRMAIYKQGLVNETSAMQSLNALENEQSDYLHNPQTGFITRRGQDALNGYPDAVKTLNDSYAKYRAALPNDAARRLFDSQAMRSTRYAVMQAGSHADSETKQWQQQTADASIANTINTGALTWNDPDRVDYNLGRIASQTLAKGELLGASKDTVSAWTSHYQSEFLSSVVHQALAHDTTAAAALFDKYRPQMDAGHIATLDQAIQTRSYYDLNRQIALETKLEMRAHREMIEGQAANFGDAFARSLSGQGAPSDNDLAEAARTQKLTPPQVEAIIAVRDGRKATTDNQEILAPFLARAYKGMDDTFVDDLAGAVKSRQITAQTMDNLLKTATAKGQRGEDETEKGLFNSLKTAVGVTPTTIFDFTKEGEKEKAALVSQMEMEWSRRVFQQRQNPNDVYDDMLPRYSKSLPDLPAAWPNPRFGAVKTMDDVGSVWQRTKDAASTGQITQDQMASEGALLQRYRAYFEQQEKTKAAQQQTTGKAGVKPKQ